MNNFNLSVSPSFTGKDIIYLDRQIKDKQDITHDVIRAHLEDSIDPWVFYYHQLANERKGGIHLRHDCEGSSACRTKSNPDKPVNKVDEKILEQAHVKALRVIRPNELYSGECLEFRPDDLDKLKEAGIKSIFCLFNNPDYGEYVKSLGMGYSDLYSVKNSHISIFDIKGELLEELIAHPEIYANDSHPKVAGLKEYLRILDGDSKEVPPPVYFGCQLGTDRTFMWRTLYGILRDCPKDEPLSPEIVEKLSEFYNDCCDHFRW